MPPEEPFVKNNEIYADETGSAIIEFLVFGVLLQVGILTLFLQISSLQTNQLVAESIARHGLRSFVLFDLDPKQTAMQISQDFKAGIYPEVQLLCQPNCFDDGSLLRLNVKVGSAEASSVFVR